MAATVGAPLLVRTTSSEAVHPPVPVVHLTVAVLPEVMVTLVVGEAGVAIVAVPLTSDHVPVPVWVIAKTALLQ
jgi:hypothetical protein